MPENTCPLSCLKRPVLLLRAARFGQGSYRRNRDLGRLIAETTSPELVVKRLLSAENLLETSRVTGKAGYSVTRHIAVLIALMAELRTDQAHV